MSGEIFPKAPLKYMPPTKFMTGNIFKGHIQDALFNMIAVWSGQSLQLLGMLTEAIHTPHLYMTECFQLKMQHMYLIMQETLEKKLNLSRMGYPKESSVRSF